MILDKHENVDEYWDSNYRSFDCLYNSLCGPLWKIDKIRITSLLWGEFTGEQSVMYTDDVQNLKNQKQLHVCANWITYTSNQYFVSYVLIRVPTLRAVKVPYYHFVISFLPMKEVTGSVIHSTVNHGCRV